MRILALDSSTAACSAAVFDGDRICAEQYREMTRGQSEQLIPMVQRVLEESGVRVSQVEMIAVTVGPGAFTGIRIGLSAARGLALAANKPLLGLTTLETLVYGIPAAERMGCRVMAAIDSKRGDFFTQMFDGRGQPLGEPVTLAPGSLSEHWSVPDCLPLVLCGDAASSVQNQFLSAFGNDVKVSASVHPRASVLAIMAAERGVPRSGAMPPAPMYLRPPDAVVPKDGGRLRP